MAKKNVNKESENVVVNSMDLEGMESVNETTSTEPQFDNIEWLKVNTPIFPEEFTSKKCKIEREPKVQSGMEQIEKIFPDLNPNFALMCKWWENKVARTTIKKALDEDAKRLGIDPVIYLQDNMRKYADMLSGLQEAVDRMKYAITYFKPRGGIKDTFKMVNINGTIYNVNLRVLGELKEKYGDNKQAILEELVKVSAQIETIDSL